MAKAKSKKTFNDGYADGKAEAFKYNYMSEENYSKRKAEIEALGCSDYNDGYLWGLKVQSENNLRWKSIEESGT